MPRKSANGSQGVLQQFQVSHLNVANQWKATEFNLPLLNLPNKSTSEYLAIEIHKIEVFKPGTADTNRVIWALTSNNLNASTSTSTSAIGQIVIDPRTVASGAIGSESYSLFDLTDDSDRGVLYPNQKLYISTTAHGNADTVVVRFFYKVVHVSQATYLAMMNNYFLVA